LPTKKPGATPMACQISLVSPKKLLVHCIDTSFSLHSYDIDLEGTVFSFCAGVDMLFHFYGRIDKILGDRDLQVIIVEATAYPQRRRFFRVDAEVVLKCWPLTEEEKPPSEAEAKRVNLSAVGLRFETTKFLKHGEKVGLELRLPGEHGQLVRCVGRVVRVEFSNDKRIEDVAIDMVGIKTDEQEKIIKFCLSEQRRQIRLKVKVLHQEIT